MHSFNIVLTNNKKNRYKNFALFILFLNFSCLLFIAYNSHSQWDKTTSISGTCLIGISLILEFYFAKNKKRGFSSQHAGLIYAVFTWLMMLYWLPAVFNTLILFLYNLSQRNLIVSVSSKSIIYPSWPKKCINWEQLNNVVLKDGLLTIDLKSNKLLQQAIDEGKSSINEQEFNDFCRQQLNK